MENLKIKGAVNLKIKQNNKTIYEFKEKNIITNNALLVICKLISSGISNANPITKIGFGTSNASPSYTDVTLQDLYIKNISNFVLEDDNRSVTFNFILDTDEDNGKTLNEIGLYTDDEILFSRRVFPNPIEKTVNIALEGTWTITLNQGE